MVVHKHKRHILNKRSRLRYYNIILYSKVIEQLTIVTILKLNNLTELIKHH